ncbi:ubiquinol Cytochrome c oxidoreductase, cytochrome c1 subunit [Sulfurihydrogenibium azorense Az-Fu1]|uniref:Ubiquinol Cytochrome c oxidoreductase, cytochrome c1 subunit n=1 Tax=Sulfurihydrogenibium azorense (strain DSM 15241 / OCM 825 / Az-Fu1) TaxID=204536 RepID=C1DT48_SULAA|nr:c-type cytochrome [Sulfurihydrogenibium azorense]ACN99147.1 ubiquinol Cytochrome c oxidoreductase, cytochrome c1 subunit [Sulfurihydrogenibium azorense Az-Fu1]
MKELKILLILIVIVAIGYWGIEPYAHSVMHGEIKKPDYKYSDLQTTALTTGDPVKGKELFMANCASCHGLKNDGINPGMDKNAAIASFNVVPPDLSNIASIVDHKFLAAFIKNPQEATKNPKFAMPPMAQLSDEDVGHVIAYLSSVAKKDLTGKDITVEACGRCHSIKYQKIQAETPADNLKAYLGKVPPDLSVMGKAKELEYLETFINNPQNGLPGTSMPRLGLTQEATEKVVKYLDEIADPHREQRNKLGVWVLGYLVVMAGLTYAWKRKIWKNLH